MSEQSKFDLHNIQLEAKHTVDVSRAVWPLLQQNARVAYTDSLLALTETDQSLTAYDDIFSYEGELALRAQQAESRHRGVHIRSQAEIDHYVSFGKPNKYREERRHPQPKVDSDGAPMESIWQPNLIIAKDGGEVVGHLLSYDLVTGATEKSRNQKRMLRLSNFRFIHEVIVSPDHQHRGIALAMAHLALKDAKFGQPAATKSVSSEYAAANRLLRVRGVTHHLRRFDYIFGPDTTPADIAIYEHPSARRLAHQIEHIPGMQPALNSMKPSRIWRKKVA